MRFWFPLLLGGVVSIAAQEAALPPQLVDLYKTDVALDAVTVSDGKSAFDVRQRVDETARAYRQSLWNVDAVGRVKGWSRILWDSWFYRVGTVGRGGASGD